MVMDILAVHIFLSEIAAFVLKNLTVQRQYFREQADVDLLFELVCGVAVDEHSFPGSMSVEVQKAKILPFAVKMRNDLFDSIDGGMILGGRVDVAPVEVYSVGVDPIVAPSHSIRVENGKQIKDKPIPEQSSLLAVLSQLTDDPSHHVRGRDFSRVDPCSDDEALLLRREFFGLIVICEQLFIFEFLIFVEDVFL